MRNAAVSCSLYSSTSHSLSACRAARSLANPRPATPRRLSEPVPDRR